jgi:hypothetical protein
MRYLLLLSFVAFIQSVNAWQASFKVDAATNNIPTSFSTAAGSQVLTGLTFPTELCIVNETAGRIGINNQTSSGSAPTGTSHYLPANSFACFDKRFARRVFVRSDTGSAISSGVIYGWVD